MLSHSLLFKLLKLSIISYRIVASALSRLLLRGGLLNGTVCLLTFSFNRASLLSVFLCCLFPHIPFVIVSSFVFLSRSLMSYSFYVTSSMSPPLVPSRSLFASLCCAHSTIQYSTIQYAVSYTVPYIMNESVFVSYPQSTTLSSFFLLPVFSCPKKKIAEQCLSFFL